MTHAAQAPPDRRPWTVLALVAVAQFMVVLDITIVNVALPSIGAALDFGGSDLQWVITAYILSSGGLLLVGGRAADLLGRRRTFLAGLLLFTTASLAAGLAPSAGALIAFRAVQGMGAALLTPSALSIVTTTYSGAQRTTAFAIWGAIASGGIAVGVILGGVLTTALSWHWVFLVNVPVGVATAMLTLRVVPATPATPAHRSLDLPGALTAVSGLAALVYGISGAADHGWGSERTLVPLALAAALLAAFAAIERTVARPLLPPRVWRVGSLVSGSAMMLGVTGLMAGAFYLNSLYLQQVLGWSALRTGLSFLPFVAAIGLGVHATSRAIGRVGSRSIVVAGMTLVALAGVLLALAPDHASYAGDLLPGFVVLGLGVGLVFPAVSIAAMSEVQHDEAGLASGFMNTAHEVGAALGVAVLAAIAAGAAGGPAAGYGDGALATAVIAGVLAVGAAVGTPAVRPPAEARVGVH